MLEAARIIGGASAVLLVLGILAWVKLMRGPALQRLDGRAVANSGNAELASQLLVFSAALGGAAALVAIAGYFAA